MHPVTLSRVLFFIALAPLLGCSEVIMQSSPDSQVLTDAFVFPDSSHVKTDGESEESDAKPVQSDAELLPGCDEFGCPCSSNQDCLDELCIEGQDGYICTKPCVTECPSGYDCVNTSAAGPDPISICVPRHIKLCRPCNSDADCSDAFALKPALCLSATEPSAGRFCGSSCDFGIACPIGFECQEITTDDGTLSNQCVKSGDECKCREAWAGMNLTTECSLENDFGACSGTRTCAEDGLTACSASVPAEEICNGVDDDCDGTVDELENSPCSSSNEWGSCEGLMVCEPNGDQTCGAQVPKAEACNTVDDDCDGEVDEETCDDGLGCTVDSCTTDGVCLNVPSEGACVIDGACYQAGDTNPLDPCLNCSPATNTNAWSSQEGGACNDGDPCTQDDVCTEGLCVGNPYVCNDALNCTGDQCDGKGGCTHAIAEGYCTIEGLCWAEGQNSPDNTCKICKTSQTQLAWSNALSGTDCDDGEACTTEDKCAPGGSCSGIFQSCDDGKWCTVDKCDGSGGCTNVAEGGCLIAGKCYVSGDVNPSNPCEICSPDSTTTFWSPDNGKSCSDGNNCTKADACQAGACIGTAYSCSDDLGCTNDVCDGSGGCSHTVNAGKCLIDGICYSVGIKNPNNACEICSNAVKQNWTDNDGASCSDGNACTDNDTCLGGVCTADYIVDNYENNNTKNAATVLGSVKDNESWPKASFDATLYGPSDVDWFTFYDDDVWLGAIHPRIDLVSIPVGSNYKLCAYYSCSGVSVSCESGSSSSYGGLPGCCSDAAGNSSESVKLNPNCSGLDDSGDVYVRVTRVSGAWTCNDYTLKWGDD